MKVGNVIELYLFCPCMYEFTFSLMHNKCKFNFQHRRRQKKINQLGNAALIEAIHTPMMPCLENMLREERFSIAVPFRRF